MLNAVPCLAVDPLPDTRKGVVPIALLGDTWKHIGCREAVAHCKKGGRLVLKIEPL